MYSLVEPAYRMGALTKIVGPSTPVGGVLMIAGYLSLVRTNAKREVWTGSEAVEAAGR